MKFYSCFLLSFLLSTNVFASDAGSLLQEVYGKFRKVSDFSSALYMEFKLPSIRIDALKGKVFYKSPDKFRIRASGIVFLPKQNPFYTLQLLRNPEAFNAFFESEEVKNGIKCKLVNVIPIGEQELIMAKLWIDPVNKLIVHARLTTRSSGTIGISQSYSSLSAYGIPSEMTFTIDMARFKVPKAIAADLNSKTEKGNLPSRGEGVILMRFSDGKVNQKFSESVFTEP